MLFFSLAVGLDVGRVVVEFVCFVVLFVVLDTLLVAAVLVDGVVSLLFW